MTKDEHDRYKAEIEDQMIQRSQEPPADFGTDPISKAMADDRSGTKELDRLRADNARLTEAHHLQETTQDAQPTLADYHQSQKEIVRLAGEVEWLKASLKKHDD